MADETNNKSNIFSKIGMVLSMTGAGMIDPAAPMKYAQALQEAEEERKKEELEERRIQVLEQALLNPDGIVSSSNIEGVDSKSTSQGRLPTSSLEPEEYKNPFAAQAFDEFVSQSSRGILPGSSLSVTGGKLGGVTVGQNPVAAAQREIAKGIALQEGKEQAKEVRGAEKSLNSTQRLIQGWVRSKNELDEHFSQIGDPTLQGFGQRTIGKGMASLGLLPQTSRHSRRIKVLANKQARDVEGGRVTDQDRKIYADAMVNALTAPNETNIGLASDAIIDLKDRGGNVDDMLKDFRESGEPIFMSVAEEVDSVLGGLGRKKDIEKRLAEIDEELKGLKNGK